MLFRSWGLTFGDLVTDTVFSSDGNRVACVGKENEQWSVVVDGSAWPGKFDMAWKPVFSQDGSHAAAKVEKNGSYHLLVDGKSVGEEFKALFNPVFSPDCQKILIKGVSGGPDEEKYYRQVLKVTDISG